MWLAFLAVQFVVALYAFTLDRERPTALWTLPLQRYGSLGGTPGATTAGTPVAGQQGV